MGGGSSMTSSIGDFSAVKDSIASLKASQEKRIMNGYELITELSEMISQVETLQIKCRQEKVAIQERQKDSNPPPDNLKKLQALSLYLDKILPELKAWRNGEELNTMRLRNVELWIGRYKDLLGKVESGDPEGLFPEARRVPMDSKPV